MLCSQSSGSEIIFLYGIDPLLYHFNPYIYLHRPSFYAEITIDKKGKEKNCHPYEKLKSLKKAEIYLNEGITFNQLDKFALELSDNEVARQWHLAKVLSLHKSMNRKPAKTSTPTFHIQFSIGICYSAISNLPLLGYKYFHNLLKLLAS